MSAIAKHAWTLLARCGAACSAVLSWYSLLVVWFLVPGVSVGGLNGCALLSQSCSQPFREVLSGEGAALIALGALGMGFVAAHPRLAPAGVFLGVAEVALFSYFVVISPLVQPQVNSSAYSWAVGTAWIAGGLGVLSSIGMIVVYVRTRTLMGPQSVAQAVPDRTT
jgi:hypothetical protein